LIRISRRARIATQGRTDGLLRGFSVRGGKGVGALGRVDKGESRP
jgi:hypothetical protein